MSTFTLNSITVKGLNVIAKLIAGSTLEFTRIAIGDGAMPSGKTPLTVTDLSHRLFDVPIDSVTSGGNGEATVTGIFSNGDRDTGFFYRELGLFAKDPASGAEILYCYGNAAADAEWISPSGASSLIEKKVKIVTLVGNAETVKAQIASGLYETKENVAKIASMKADLDTTAANGGRLLASQMRLDQEQTLYVDAAAATGGDGSEAKPFKTIQAAINARYLGAPVIYIKIKAGTYSEDIKTPRAPNTTWRLMKNGTGVVMINTAIIDNCNYVVFDSLTFKGGAVANSTIIYIANTASANFNNVTVNGNANLTGIHFATSRGVLNNTQLNNCGLAIAATEGGSIDLRNTSGIGNVRGVYADGAFVTCSRHTIQATTPFSRINGGGISTEGGASSLPSNYAQLYNLGDFTTIADLQTAILAELGRLALGESRACYFSNNIPGGYGPFAGTQRMQAYITKSTNYGNGYGTVFFRSHHDAPAAYQQIQDGYFAQPTPVKFITNSDMASPTAYGLVRAASAEDEINCTCNDAAVTPEVLYKVVNFRKVNTAYSVGDTVGCAYHNGMQLKCTKAGTTSAEALDTHTAQAGDIITDGGVVWEVHKTGSVQTINGVGADNDGNVNVKSLVPTIINTAVDLNDYKTAGVYLCTGTNTASTCTNIPDKKAFYLEIIELGGSCKQIFTTYAPSNPRMFIRTYYVGDNIWGEWKEIAYKNDIPLIPVGIILPFAGNGSVPAGWVICNGAAVSRSTYAALFAAIGTTYGAGNGSTTFNLPNLTNSFIEGSNTAGTVLAAGLPNITGNMHIQADIPEATGALYITSTNNTGQRSDGNQNGDRFAFDASRSNSIYGKSDTVQPPALTMRYCIKY